MKGHTSTQPKVWGAVEKHRVTSISVVGDPFAKPMLRVLDENPGRYDLSSLAGMSSSGAMFTEEVKDGLINHAPALVITDSFASTEAMGMGVSTASKDGHVKTADFQLTEYAIVIDENDNRVGAGESGLVAFGGPQPLGYYKDEAKTAKTFRHRSKATRFVVPGDFARVEQDGSVTLLGRGSNCINTAGEKVFPEEVEEALKTHASVEDALVLGVPDEKWGQAVTGVVVLSPGASFDEADLRTHVRGQLAGYKTPKRILIAGVNLRAPNGKADYKAVGEFARRELGGRVVLILRQAQDDDM
ncbi:MAG: AMP-binding protein [Rhizomicrobium sp.]